MVTKERTVATDAEQRIMPCRMCQRQMWHVRNNRPCWLCSYCDLTSMQTKTKTKTPRSKKIKYESYKLKYQDLYLQIVFARSHKELDEVLPEVQGLILTEPAEYSIELREIIAAGREMRNVLNGRRFDGGELNV